MKKIVKWISILIVVLALIMVLGVTLLVTFVSPDRLKPLLTEKVQSYMGREVTIDGELSWTIFPILGLKTGHVTINNPAEFQQKIFMEVDQATVKVKLLPLLRKQIQSSAITLDGVTLNLIKNSQGVSNWDFQKKAVDAGVNAPTVPSSAEPRAPVAISISSISVTKANVAWIDESKKRTLNIKNLKLEAHNINSFEPFSLSGECDFIGDHPAVSGHAQISSLGSINLDKQIFSFRTVDVKTTLEQKGKKFNIHLKGDVNLDKASQTLQWGNFEGELGSVSLKGSLNINNLNTNPVATGHVNVAPFDLKQWLQETGADVSAIQVFKNVSGSVEFAPSADSTRLQGKFKIDELKANNIRITNLNVPMNYQDSILTLSNVSGDFYKGTMRSDVKINLTNDSPPMALQTKLNHFNAEALMQDIGGEQKLKLTGDGDVDIQLTTIISGGNASLKNLNGGGHFSFSQGVLQGIDIAYLLSSAEAFVNKKSVASENSKQTHFNGISGSFTIRNGVVSNNDLLVKSSEFTTNGQGRVDLVDQTLNYHLQTVMNQANTNANKNSLFNLSGLPIPIIISGSLKSPHVGLDAEELAKALAKQQIKNVESQVQDKILKGKVPEKAGQLLQNLFGH